MSIFNWFKRTPEQTWEDFLAEQPEPPCGDKETHYRWRIVEGMPCPKCTLNRQIAKERQDREALAEAIASKVLAGLKGKT